MGAGIRERTFKIESAPDQVKLARRGSVRIGCFANVEPGRPHVS